jgi:hypothetical protein
MLKGRIEKPVPAVFLSLSDRELERLRAGEMFEVDGAKRLGVDARLQLYGSGSLPAGGGAPS